MAHDKVHPTVGISKANKKDGDKLLVLVGLYYMMKKKDIYTYIFLIYIILFRKSNSPPHFIKKKIITK